MYNRLDLMALSFLFSKNDFKNSRVRRPSRVLLALQFRPGAPESHELYLKMLRRLKFKFFLASSLKAKKSRRKRFKLRRSARYFIFRMRRSVRRLKPYKLSVKFKPVRRSMWTVVASCNKLLARPVLAFKFVFNKLMGLVLGRSETNFSRPPRKSLSLRVKSRKVKSIRVIKRFKRFLTRRNIDYVKPSRLAEGFKHLSLRSVKVGKKKSIRRIRGIKRWFIWAIFSPALMIRLSTGKNIINGDLSYKYRQSYKTVMTSNTGYERFHAGKNGRRRITLGKYLVREMYRLTKMYKARFIGILGACHKSILRFARKNFWKFKKRKKRYFMFCMDEIESHNGCQFRKERKKKKLRRKKLYSEL